MPAARPDAETRYFASYATLEALCGRYQADVFKRQAGHPNPPVCRFRKGSAPHLHYLRR